MDISITQTLRVFKTLRVYNYRSDRRTFNTTREYFREGKRYLNELDVKLPVNTDDSPRYKNS